MNRFREKISTFIFGVTVGLLIGLSVFIFKLDEYIRNFQFSSKEKEKTEEITSNQNQRDDQDSDRKKNSKTENEKKWTGKRSTAEHAEKKNDTLTFSESGSMNSDDNISILKEELVGVKNVRIKTEEDQQINKKDTALRAVSGIEEKASGNYLIIEFWKTPLNSKGYRMSRNKIILYGLPEEELDIVKIDDVFYLKHTFGIFKLEYSNEFRKMEKVNESSILARLN